MVTFSRNNEIEKRMVNHQGYEKRELPETGSFRRPDSPSPQKQPNPVPEKK